MCKPARMDKPQWQTEDCYPPNTELYPKLKLSPMESWVSKIQVATMITKTQPPKTIHELEIPETQSILEKLQHQWRQRARENKTSRG